MLKTQNNNVFEREFLNDFAGLGPEARKEARDTIQKIFSEGSSIEIPASAILELSECEMTLPMFIRDYTDFYSSKNHAYNVGVMFRGPDNAL